MPLSGLQRKQIQDALIAAFGNEDNLRQTIRLQMGVNLESVAIPGNIGQGTPSTFDMPTADSSKTYITGAPRAS